MNKRKFIKSLLLLGTVGQHMLHAPAALAKPQLVSESEQEAMDIGYVHDSQNAAAKSAPFYKAGSKCSTCRHFRTENNSGLGYCAMYFHGRLVKAEGWCAGWIAAR